MSETLTYFPKYSFESRKDESSAEGSDIVINGAKVIFDKEVPLMPVTLKIKKEQNDGGK